MKNRAELLIESLFSIFLITILLTYISNNIYKSLEIIKKYDEKILEKNDYNNLVEYVKSFNYNKIIKMKNNYTSLSSLNINKKYFKYINQISLDIIKTNMYIIYNDEKKYIYIIKVGDIYDYYIPK